MVGNVSSVVLGGRLLRTGHSVDPLQCHDKADRSSTPALGNVSACAKGLYHPDHLRQAGLLAKVLKQESLLPLLVTHRAQSTSHWVIGYETYLFGLKGRSVNMLGAVHRNHSVLTLVRLLKPACPKCS